MDQCRQKSPSREPLTAIATRVTLANEIVSAVTTYAVLSASLMVGLAGRTYAADRVTVGVARTISDAPLFIAAAKHFFQENSLDVTIVNFRAAIDMVPMLATGQADVVAASASAGFYNAMTSDIKIKIVADKASSPPGYGATKILIRKDHVESQRYRSPSDLKGMKVALNAPGVSNTATLNSLLKSVGLKYSDVQTVYIPLPDHVAALANKSVDATASVEPGPTMSIANGSALLIKSDDDVIPNHETAVLLYSEAFVTRKRDLATRFMRSYLRGVRFYNDALKDGRLAGQNANDVISILSASTPLKDVSIYQTMTPPGINPDGKVNVESLQSDLDFYKEQGWATGTIRVDQVVDSTFVEEVLKQLGPYRR